MPIKLFYTTGSDPLPNIRAWLNSIGWTGLVYGNGYLSFPLPENYDPYKFFTLQSIAIYDTYTYLGFGASQSHTENQTPIGYVGFGEGSLYYYASVVTVPNEVFALKSLSSGSNDLRLIFTVVRDEADNISGYYVWWFGYNTGERVIHATGQNATYTSGVTVTGIVYKNKYMASRVVCPIGVIKSILYTSDYYVVYPLKIGTEKFIYFRDNRYVRCE
ncbi:MAG: hypothetical protein QXR39_09365 [Candidatus Methanomethylicia archaeon]